MNLRWRPGTGVRGPRREVETTIGGILFAFAGLVTIGGMLAPHADEADTGGLMILAAGLVVVGAALLLVPHEFQRRAPPVMVGVALVSCTVGIHLNGERAGGLPMFNELFYFWPVLYVGYFFAPRGIALTLAGIAAGYAYVLSQLGQDLASVLPRYTITLTSLVGIAVAMRLLRRHVDRLVDRLNDLARTDVLTGLVNRRAFDETLQHELERAARTREPFALLLGDVDHFKAINDRRGHAAGDAALADVAAQLRASARAIDTVARVGGEEFALILPGASRARGVQTAERLRHVLRTSGADHGDPVTMSFGVAEAPADGRTADDLLRMADRALYAAKAAGRDRTVTSRDATVQIAGELSGSAG